MATCIRCDKCGKIMEEFPIGHEHARKTFRIDVETIYKSKPEDKPEARWTTRSIRKDLCSDCCWGLETAIFKYMEEKGENNEEKALR